MAFSIHGKVYRLSFIALCIVIIGVAVLRNLDKSTGKSGSGKSDLMKVARGATGKVRWKFTKLAAGEIARSGKLVVTENSINDLVLHSLLDYRKELFIILSLNQFVIGKSPNPGPLTFNFPAPARALPQAFAVYGAPFDKSLEINFQPGTSNDLELQMDGRKFGLKDIDQSDIAWGANESEIFRRKLQLIDEKLKFQALAEAAAKENLTSANYVKKYVYADVDFTPSDEKIDEYLTDVGLPKDEKGVAVARNQLSQLLKKQRIDYFLEKYILDLPIQVAIDKPNFSYDIRFDWTPSLGPEDSPLKVIVIGDFWTRGSQGVLKSIPKLADEFPQVYFGFRPFYIDDERYQRTLAELAFCGWKQDKKKFWQFLTGIFAIKKEAFDDDIKSATQIFGKASLDVHNCLLQRKFQEVADYHLNYAKYLRLKTSPVVLVGSEVFIGNPKVQEIREAIGRAVNSPTAAQWHQ